MSEPSNYDSTSMVIKVDPTALWGLSQSNLPNDADVVAFAIGNIQSIWQELTLGWAGTTADEAQDFNTRWNTAISALFGSQTDPTSGVLSKIADAVGTASLNYAETESTITTMFTSFSSSLNSGSGTTQAPARSDNDGPITENTPAYTMPS